MMKISGPVVVLLSLLLLVELSSSYAETGGPAVGPPTILPERAEPPPLVPQPYRKPLPIKGGNYYYELAEVHKKYGLYDKAIEMLEMAIEKEPDSANKVRFYESLGEAYELAGKPKEAAEQIKKALASAQTLDEKCRYNTILGRTLEAAGDLEEAKKAYQFVVANATRDAVKRAAQASLYRLLQRSGQLNSFIADLEKRLEQNPADQQALESLAEIYNSVVRDPASALRAYERLARLDPKDTATLNRLVYLYQVNKEYEKAAEVYQKIIEASPPVNRTYYYQHVSRMYMLAGKKDEAVKWAEKSLSEGETRPYSYLSVAQVYLQNNMVEEALQLYSRADEACRSPIEKHQLAVRFADLFARSGKEDKAEELYKLVLQEGTVESLKAQARSKLISLYRQQGKEDEVKKLTAEQGGTPEPPK
jgi:tetratricopeptide (TPR) repeat protein